MTSCSADLLTAAERLDESPEELLNGGATAALQALESCQPDIEALAAAHGIDFPALNALWERASVRLRETPTPEELFPAAADAAGLLYAAAWVLRAESVTTDDLQSML
ncbi:MAG TPA: hypothetical protein VK501_22865 [Baekduia sp.]|uniref:hypothetical protein n=1 Tax=Baekduia sp. TaxID=2600305 RepID=UPI002C15FEC9|nr:hypothetical protein [Baekduia sp.]HMJ36764.1 hypothetical protein [Baekduia sp.]